MLEEVYKSYRKLADEINWQNYNQNDLFFEYINHENDNLANNFYAAIVCRYWGYTGRLYLQCNKHISFEQCYDVLIDTINYVLKKRAWEDSSNSLFGDKRAPDKAFHIVLKRQRSILLANLTAYKRRSNFNTLSIDSVHEEYNDAAEGLFNIADVSENNITLMELIKNRNDTLQTIFLDQICFNQWESLQGAVKNVKKINKTDFIYYFENYNISEKDFNNVLLRISKLTNARLLSELKKTLYLIRKELIND